MNAEQRKVIEEAAVAELRKAGAFFGPATLGVFMTNYADRVEFVNDNPLGIEGLVQELKAAQPDAFMPTDMLAKDESGKFVHNPDAIMSRLKKSLPSGMGQFPGFSSSARGKALDDEMARYKLSLMDDKP